MDSTMMGSKINRRFGATPKSEMNFEPSFEVRSKMQEFDKMRVNANKS